MQAGPARRAVEALSLDELKHIDAVCARFEIAWEAGAKPSLEDYLATAPEPLRTQLFWELLLAAQELCLRRGETVQATSLRARFPEYAGIIDSVLLTIDSAGSACVRQTAPDQPGTGSR
jgi:serine/threonine-protein kinase